MTSNTTALTRSISEPEFDEHHCRVIEAPAERVWQGLQQLRWVDLGVAQVLMMVRGLGGSGRLSAPCLELFTPVCVRTDEPPLSCSMAMIGRPWSPFPRSRHPHSFDEVAAFTEPGWLKYGMDFTLTPLDGGRTLIETRTLCQPTDAHARRAFGRYWRLIGPFSGLIRMRMLTAIDRLATDQPRAV